MNTRESIDKTIDDLRRLIEQAVRDEQLRHQLTGLPNERALQEHIQRAISGGGAFWVAFLEIDRFKSINDRFGYVLADALLLEVARTLKELAPRYFASQAEAFHAHGDEFYVLGLAPSMKFAPAEIARKLDAIRVAIANIALAAGEAGELMTCTVSIGWREGSGGIAHDLLHDLEIAVAQAKRLGRNQVVLYDESMRKDPVVSLRSECSECKTAFSFEAPSTTLRQGDVFCPNCGAPGPRPVHAALAPPPQDITDLPSVEPTLGPRSNVDARSHAEPKPKPVASPSSGVTPKRRSAMTPTADARAALRIGGIGGIGGKRKQRGPATRRRRRRRAWPARAGRCWSGAR